MSLLDKVREKLLSRAEGSDVPIESAQDQDIEDIKLAGFVKSQVEACRSQGTRISSEGIWMTNIAYLLGFDSVYYDPTLRQFRPTAPNLNSLKRNRVHSNQLLPATQNRLSRMIKNPPKYEVRPNSSSEEDKEAAQLGLEAIGMVWDRQQINKKRIELGMWKQQCGHAYGKISFDDQLGDPVVDPQTGEVTAFTGEARFDVCSAFEMFPDPLAKSFEDLSWIVQAKVRKLDYFRLHYPERGAIVQQEEAWLLSAQYEMRINSLNTVGPSSSGTSEQMKNAAIELSYYEKRSPKYPNGRHVIVANGVVLKNADLPFGGEIPFAKFDDVVVGGKYYSETYLTHARPLQDQYNRTLIKRAEWTNKLLAGKYIAAKGHGILQNAINNSSGEVVEYDPVPNAAEPKAMSVPTIPEYAYKESDDFKNQIYEMMGLSEISRGILPSASIPAEGMQILLEQDETRMGVEVEQDEHAWARIGMLILKCIDANYVMERKLKSKGKSLKYDVKEFKGADLRKNFDVTVVRGSTTPNVRVLERQEIMNAYKEGLLGDPMDPALREQVLGWMQYGDIGQVWEEYRADMSQINKTIKQIEAEEIPLVSKYDNHALHLKVKNKYRKSDKWDMLSDASKQIFIFDMDSHVTQGATLSNPQAFQKPDNGPPPDIMLAMLDEQAKGLGIDSGASMPQDNMEIQ